MSWAARVSCIIAHNSMNRQAPTAPGYEREAELLRALAHPVRLKILRFLADQPRCGCELEPHLDLDQSTISRHLGTLKRVGLVASHKRGVKVIYRLGDERVLKLLRDVSETVTRRLQEELAAMEAGSER